MSNEVNHPKHYTWIPGVEVIDILEPLCKKSGWNVTNAVKYLLRADNGKGKPEQDLRKAVWYIQRELENRAKRSGQADRDSFAGTITTGDSLRVQGTVQRNACANGACPCD